MPLAKFAFLALVATILLISITSVEAGKKKRIKELKKQLAVCQEEKSNLEKELEEKEEEVEVAVLEKQGWVRHENAMYRFVTQRQTFDGAIAWCKRFGAELTSVKTVSQHRFIQAEIRKHTGNYYIGGTDAAREGQFYWVPRPSDLVKEHFWARGQPDNWQNDEDCMTYQATTVLWNDVSCSLPANFICQRILE